MEIITKAVAIVAGFYLGWYLYEFLKYIASKFKSNKPYTLRYRIHHKSGLGYYPHVKIKGKLFDGGWHRIGVHNCGFGRYPLPDIDYPKTEIECEKIIRDFDEWFETKNKSSDTYSDFILK